MGYDNVGFALACAVGASAVGVTALSVPFVLPAFRRVCLPYVPATECQIKNVMRLLEKCPPVPISPLIDLGSGDGRVVTSHLTPEWRKQYIRYEELKSMLYDLMLEAPTETDARDQYVTQMDETFFAECEKELTKISLFFSQKIAEAQGKYHELSAELNTFTESIESRQTPLAHRNNVRVRFSASTKLGQSSKLQREQAKTAQQLKLAFSEFYLNLVLLQNYQQLNATGFRKILKKHDKLMLNDRGIVWRINRVEKSTFFLNADIESLINNVETTVINELEGGNRQAGMKRLKVPPLSEKQSASTTFSLGMFMGIFIVLAVAIILSSIGLQHGDNNGQPKWVAVRLFRGFFLCFLSMWLCGLNMYGWAASGVNHVLIFEVDPRNHLTYQTIMQISSFLMMLWALAVLGFLYADWLFLPPFLFPLLLMFVCVLFLLTPFKSPDQFFHRNSRFWFLKHCFNCLTAPFHFVTFSDFWLGDQMNSLTTCFLDLQYFICFYATEVDYSGAQLHVRTLNVTEGPIPWGFVDVNTGQDMCVSSVGIRSAVSVLPALVRFLQCLRRYRDSRAWHPHLVNAGKYATTFLVVATNSLSKWWSMEKASDTTLFFYLWIASYIISFTYTFLWDVFMDWGLIDPKAPKEAPFLREEMIYGSKWYYYFAIFEDFVLRLSWVMNVSLAEAWTLHADFLVCIMAPLEVIRRFIWNYFRLENEHVNNCGQFRAVRDISVKPIRKGDLESLLMKMDEQDGVTHRGQDLRDRVKKQKKAAREKKQILRKNRITRISLPAIHPQSCNALIESKH
uniref:Xenotropic and polytropic retrovirus receptor 1 n=1 Tax=Globodera rostochiensis TaxID=31243 RepID=A0A914HAM7_GLORO